MNFIFVLLWQILPYHFKECFNTLSQHLWEKWRKKSCELMYLKYCFRMCRKTCSVWYKNNFPEECCHFFSFKIHMFTTIFNSNYSSFEVIYWARWIMLCINNDRYLNPYVPPVFLSINSVNLSFLKESINSQKDWKIDWKKAFDFKTFWLKTCNYFS